MKNNVNRVLVLVLFKIFLLSVSQKVLAVDIGKYDVFESTFTHSGTIDNPYNSLSATAQFTSPTGSTYSIQMFWDGGTTWKARFSPDQTGLWTYKTTSSNTGLNNQTGSFNCVSSTKKGGIRKRSDTPYHFERQDGTPFYFFGDTEWSLFTDDATENHNYGTVETYINVRASQGFNVIHAMLLNALGWNNNGGAPFNSFTNETLNPLYWQEVDKRIKYLNSKDITAGLLLAWASDARDWMDFENDTERRRFARYVASRYSAYNVYFIGVGEYNEYSAGTKETFASLIGQEIYDNDPHKRIITMHSTNTVEVFANNSWSGLGDYQQVYTSMNSAILDAKDHNKPVVNSEYAYYLRPNKQNSGDLTTIRNATYDIAMAGGYFITGFGTTYFGGARMDGTFNVNASINDDWEEDLKFVKSLFTSVDWYNLSSNNSLVTGSGTKYCLANPGNTYLFYVRGNSGSNSLNLNTSSSKSYSIQRFNPRDGSLTTLTGYTGTGPINFTNSDNSDWVYVVKATQSTGQAPSASISATSTTTVFVNENVDFSVTANDPDGSISSYVWNWGNSTQTGTGSPSSTISKSWSTVGKYTVSLTVQDNQNLTGVSNNIEITVTSNKPPVISEVNASPNTGSIPLNVTITAIATDPDNNTLSYSWDLNGDGNYGDATGSTINYTYTVAGNFTPTVRVSDGTNQVTKATTVDADNPSSNNTINVNFEPSGTLTPSGYLSDIGAVYGNRSNGYSYGWNATNANARNRSVSGVSLLQNTFNHMQKGSTFTWEIGVNNGVYEVNLMMGDPSFIDQLNSVLIENITVNDSDGKDNYDLFSAITVTVTDGKLTISPTSTASNAKIAYVEITSKGSITTPNPGTTTGSVLPWTEDFTLSNGTNVDNGSTKWSLVSTGMTATATFSVQSNQLTISDVDVEVKWLSEVITVSSAGSIKVSAKFNSNNAGNLDPDDFLGLHYTINGGSEVLISNQFDDFASNIVAKTFTVAAGDKIRLIAKARNTSSNEIYYLDDVKVESVASGAKEEVVEVSDYKVTVFPNPTSDKITFIGVLPGTAYGIYSMTGELVKSGLVSESFNNVEDLSVGVYFIRLKDQSATTLRICKQ
ncbi:MAG: DUF4038 domain-containing protein [Bacteroidota bacterium]|nr:DUF4038 domain-containing protein [Bacteroidota bacterium]